MKRKEYMKPAIGMEHVYFEKEILAASGIADGDTPGDEYNEDDVTYSKPNKGFWGIGDDSEY